MTVQRQRLARPVPPKRGSIQNQQMVPFKGMRTDVPPQNLRPGETPYSENFVINNGVLEARSGVSAYSASSIADWGTTHGQAFRAYMQGFQLDGTRWDLLLADSNTTAWGAYSTDTAQTWTDDSSTLSTIFPTGVAGSPWSWTQFFDPTSKENAIAATSNYTLPIYRPLKAASDWTHFSDIISHESTVGYVESFDNRLILANTAQGSDTFGNRVRWSVRGSPTDFTSVGAGFEDLTDMRGSITGLTVEEDHLLVFSEFEIWRGRPRRDAYAFDFDILEKDRGSPWPDTLVRTPAGTIWLGRDFNFYRVVDGTVRVFTPDLQRYLQEVITEDNASTIKAQYDTKEGLYMLFFVRDVDASQYQYGVFMRVNDIRSNGDGTKDKADWMLQNLVGSSGYLATLRGHDNVLPTTSYNYLLPNLYHLNQDWYYDTTQIPQGMVQIWTSPGIRGTKDPSTFEAVSDLLMDYSYEAASSASTLHMRFLTRHSHDTGWNHNSARSLDLEGTPNIYSPDDVWGASYNLVGAAAYPTTKTVHIPMTPEAARYTQFMLYNKGSLSDITTADAAKSNPEAKLRIHNLRATIRPWSGKRPY